MDKFFSILGKALVVLGIVGILVGGGYYLGTKFNKPASLKQSTAVSTIPTSQTPTTSANNAAISPTPTPVQHDETGRFAVNAGGIKPFSAYLLSGVAGWIPAKTHDNGNGQSIGSDKLVLTKGDYSVTILQGGFDGGACFFPGETPTGMAVVLTAPVTEIPLLNGTILKRGQADPNTNPGKQTDDICQRSGAQNQYGLFTDFGIITYVTPLNPDTSILAEMDAMVGSLQKQ